MSARPKIATLRQQQNSKMSAKLMTVRLTKLFHKRLAILPSTMQKYALRTLHISAYKQNSQFAFKENSSKNMSLQIMK